jgi:glycosyltransferase involved in cell wall biosynthesis
MSTADISVVIAAYNAAPFIARAIRSLRAQSRRPQEIIVVDDGSCDGTSDVVRALGEDLVVVRQENRGPGPARNVGVQRARSTFVSFLDADDEYLPHAVETYERAMTDFPKANVASGATVLIWAGVASRRPAQDLVLGGSARAAILPDFFEVARRHPFVVNTNSVVVRKDAFVAVGGFREDVRFAEDLDLWGRLAGRYDWVFVDEPVNVYHFSPPNVYVSASRLRNPHPELPIDPFMSEERMRRFVRPELWASYRRYRRDKLCGAARASLARSEARRARRLLATIPPAPVSPNWLATWLLAHLPLGARLLALYHVVRPVHRKSAQEAPPGQTSTAPHVS